jgi:hypothetical protein
MRTQDQPATVQNEVVMNEKSEKPAQKHKKTRKPRVGVFKLKNGTVVHRRLLTAAQTRRRIRRFLKTMKQKHRVAKVAARRNTLDEVPRTRGRPTVTLRDTVRTYLLQGQRKVEEMMAAGTIKHPDPGHIRIYLALELLDSHRVGGRLQLRNTLKRGTEIVTEMLIRRTIDEPDPAHLCLYLAKNAANEAK